MWTCYLLMRKSLCGRNLPSIRRVILARMRFWAGERFILPEQEMETEAFRVTLGRVWLMVWRNWVLWLLHWIMDLNGRLSGRKS